MHMAVNNTASGTDTKGSNTPAAAAGLRTQDGILVDGHARSLDDPDVLAIGDVARHPLPRFGVTLRQESWRHAEAQARHAAAALQAALRLLHRAPEPPAVQHLITLRPHDLQEAPP